MTAEEQGNRSRLRSESEKAAEPRPKLRLEIGQRFGEGKLHEICDKPGLRRGRRSIARSMGAGGAGTVYACQYGAHKQRRAVKFLTSNLLDPDKTGNRSDDFRLSFDTERSVLSQLSHSHVSVFHEDGTERVGDTDWHYPTLSVALNSGRR